MTTQLLIDADFVLYRDCSAVERVASFTNPHGDTVDILNCSREEAKDNFLKSVQGYMTKLNADEAVLVFSGRSNFRYEVWAGYKGNRAESRKPVSYWEIVRELREDGEFRVVSEDCLEGDDYIGILATRPSSVRRVIVSEDKDMQTLPNVEIYRQGAIVETDQDSADRFWRLQTLMGDSTDGYHGCPGIGPKSAETILDKPGDPWVNILAAYEAGCRKKPAALEKAGVETAEELALLNARLARILRFTDWDGSARRPILWSPEGQV
jgi:5'-3' exonuclease